MLMVAIIGILAVAAVPKFAELLVRTYDSSTKGNLGALRSAMSVYYSDVGTYPSSMNTLTPKYINKIPEAVVSAHN